jgi:cytochrome oxidase Cu insertion factor (SCO1/SenC/PrrC family)
MTRSPISALLMATVVSAACGGGSVERDLGPADGHDLPPADTGRVAVGEPAPDFSLESYAGPVVTLSDYRGQKEVILVFYRGYW